MNLIRLAVERPVALLSVVLMVLIFGMVALSRIPVQLAPDVDQPTISITTAWGGAAPEEVEREILFRQEEALKGLENVRTVTSNAELGRARVTLEFAIGTNIDRALLLVANRLQQISGYPTEVDEPVLSTAGTDDNPIAWFSLIRAAGNERPIPQYGDLVEDVVRERLQRVEGVSEVNVYGGAERRIEVLVLPEALARYRLTVSDLVDALRAANATVSAGDVEEGKRSYVVRAEGELKTADAVRAVVIRAGGEGAGSTSFGRVTVGDIAQVQFGYPEPRATIRQLGRPALSLNVTRETGANVILVMDGIRAAVTELNEGVLAAEGLQLLWNYDETTYIESSIELVESNIYIGGALAALVLFVFLRSFGATAAVAFAIPISLIGAFVAMAALGRSINVISLAGLAFAVGMVVDAAIVVQENIFRLREGGMRARQAAADGAQQVWGAVMAGAVTTVLVFVPILILELEVGQLFRDIAVALSVAIVLSLVVAVTVVPSLSARLLNLGRDKDAPPRRLRVPLVDGAAGLFARFVGGYTRVVVRSRTLSLAVVAVVSVAAGTAAWMFLPKLEYLPEGNRNLVIGRIAPPPGYNLRTVGEIAGELEDAVASYWADPSASMPEDMDPEAPPKMQRFFFVALPTQIIIGATAEDDSRAAELVPIIQDLLYREPGAYGATYQPSIFGRGVSGGRTIELDVTGPTLSAILPVAQQAMAQLNGLFPREDGNQIRPQPGLEFGAPELRVLPDRVRLADAGVTVRQFADSIDAFNDGLRAAEVTVEGKRMDLTVLGTLGGAGSTQDIANLPVVTASGVILPVSALATIELTAGPVTIRHRERLRTITLEIRPTPDIPLEQALEMIQEQVVAPLSEAGLPAGVGFSISGTADRLTETFDAMIWNLLLAVAIVYLVMAILFESFVYPLVMMLSVPLAAAGGIAGLAVVNAFVPQPMDMLTLLGFVILIGTVVNNAILLVHQSLYHLRHEHLPPASAIYEATRNRIRPIFMSTVTSVAGMLPLVAAPGAGSELYRGIGAVVVGGLMLSAVLTLFVVPPMLSVVMSVVERKRAARHLVHAATHPAE